MASVQKLDILIIGSGFHGYWLAQKLSNAHQMTIVEDNRIGGNHHLIQSITINTMHKLAVKLMAIQTEHDLLLHKSVVLPDTATVRKKLLSSYNSSISKYYNAQTVNGRVKLIKGVASFTDNKTILINGHRFTFQKCILATGSTPIMPTCSGSQFLLNEDNFWQVTVPFVDLALIGITESSIALAQLYAVLGFSVTLVSQSDTLLPNLDDDLNVYLYNLLHTYKVKLIFGLELFDVSKIQSKLALKFQNGSKLININVDQAIVFGSRQPSITKTSYQSAGILANDYGGFAVTDNFQTAVSNIFANGSCTGQNFNLWDSRQAINSLLATLKAQKLSQKISRICIATIPKFIVLGTSENELVQKGINYEKISKQSNDSEYDLNYQKITVHFDSKNTILGAVIIGKNAEELADILEMIMNSNLGIDNFVEYHNNFMSSFSILFGILSERLQANKPRKHFFGT